MMSKLSNLCLGTALALSIGLPAVAQDNVTPETVVATVNGVEITVGHLALARAALPDQYKQLPAEVLFNGLREQLVQQTLLAQSLDTLPRQLELLIENERRSMIAGEALGAAVDAEVTDEAVRTAYERDFASASPGLEYNASHILLETEEAAQAAIERVQAGEEFADLARELSTGPSGPNGGQLGWFGRGQMVKPFEDAVVAMASGTVSGPVQTQFGFHVIRLNETRDEAIPALEEVRGDILRALEEQAAKSVIEALMENADIVTVDGIDPAAIMDGAIFVE